ncbi:phage tail length tape measure family protein [Mesorhizobium sp. B2-1-3A]|uniref:phage tail length tape measure family protein n=1 Tax=Mesorhizobium sp. B2-1-3A TaxID=2589971 RepID=UPI001129B2EF|nr:phage tail length tape measure family protein [Mesorhizobium sp. B2-1-3A]TPM92731.1 hypothetical protein FJ977_28025 [Mesorhizobium sp. B2-1-3A]
MAIEAERLLAIFEARFTSLEKALVKAQASSKAAFSSIEADGTAAEDALANIGNKGTPGIDKAGKAVKAFRVDTGNLAAQFNDIGVQLAGGQSPFLIALQQGTQITQALGPSGAKGAVAALGGAFLSMINPVSLATIAIIAGGGFVVQYFASLLDGGEKSAETLKQEAELIQRVTDKWGDALPALKAYADERQKLADQKDAVEATQVGKEGAFEDARNQVNSLRSDLGQLISDLSTFGGQEEEVGKLQSAFVDLDEKIKNQTATADDAKRVQDLLADAMNSTHIPAAQSLADAFIRVASALGVASQKAIDLDSNLAKIDTNPDTAGPKGFHRSNATPVNAPVPELAPNREDVLAAQDKAAAAAARRASHGQRLSADDRIQEDIQGLKDRTEALRQEADMIGLSYEEQQKRKMALDLEQEALKRLREEAARKGATDLDSIKLSPDQVAAIDAASDAYAHQAEILRQVREQQQQAEQAAGEFYDTFKSGVIGAITGAESLKDALSGVLDKLADMLLNSAFDALFKPQSGSSSGGTFGSIFSAIGSFITGSFASGTKSAPGGLAWVGERGRELVNLPKGSQVVPHDVSEKLATGSSSRASTYSNNSRVYNIDARGAQQGVGAEIQKALAAYDSRMPDRVKQINGDPRAR